MSYAPDPGGVFASDAHRRVMANAPNPDDDPLSVEELLEQRVAKDEHLDIDRDDLEDVLKDLEADGHVKQLKDGWKNTPDGFAALTGPIKEN
jgi:CBS-domain-containing membrane protein